MKICVVCEGSYPFVAGGVSSWLQGLMQGMPQHTFIVWAIGAQKKQRGKYAYKLPPNVAEVREVFLDEVMDKQTSRRKHPFKLNAEQKNALRHLFSCDAPDWPVLFSLFERSRKRNLEFLTSVDFLNLLGDISLKDYPYVGFTDYLWTVRSMFLPLLYLMGETPPQADLYYSVSAGYAGVLGVMAASRNNRPFMLTEHGIYTREREEEILRTNWVPPHFKDLWINMFYMFTRCAYRYATRVTSLYYQSSLIQQEIGCSAEKCVVIPNGVRYDLFAGVPPKAPDGFVDIAAVVRIAPIKDIKTMLYAFSLACADNDHLRLHILGPTDEDEEYYEECLRVQEDLDLTNVHFTGRVDVREYLAKIDFTLLTSISEGQPLAVLEAMAAGRPAVTTDVGSCRELLFGNNDDFGQAGICVPVMHQSALSDAILTLADEPALRTRMGQAGKKRVAAGYGYDTMLSRYEHEFQTAHIAQQEA